MYTKLQKLNFRPACHSLLQSSLRSLAVQDFKEGGRGRKVRGKVRPAKKAHVSELSVCWLTENSDWSESRF